MTNFAWDRLLCLVVLIATLGFWYTGDLHALPAGLIALLAVAGFAR